MHLALQFGKESRMTSKHREKQKAAEENLPIGSRHHRAVVGSPEKYGLGSAMQVARIKRAWTCVHTRFREIKCSWKWLR